MEIQVQVAVAQWKSNELPLNWQALLAPPVTKLSTTDPMLAIVEHSHLAYSAGRSAC